MLYAWHIRVQRELMQLDGRAKSDHRCCGGHCCQTIMITVSSGLSETTTILNIQDYQTDNTSITMCRQRAPVRKPSACTLTLLMAQAHIFQFRKPSQLLNAPKHVVVQVQCSHICEIPNLQSVLTVVACSQAPKFQYHPASINCPERIAICPMR